MRPAAVACAAAVALTVGGCGSAGGTSDSGLRSTEAPKAKSMAVRSPALEAGGVFPPHYGCARPVWLPLRWSKVPPDAAELVLYTGGFGPPKSLGEGTTFTPLVTESLVVGLKPTLDGLSEGALPSGASLLVEQGDAICPPRIPGGEFVFRLFALSAEQRLDADALRGRSLKKAMDELYTEAIGVGDVVGSYRRAGGA